MASLSLFSTWTSSVIRAMTCGTSTFSLKPSEATTAPKLKSIVCPVSILFVLVLFSTSVGSCLFLLRLETSLIECLFSLLSDPFDDSSPHIEVMVSLRRWLSVIPSIVFLTFSIFCFEVFSTFSTGMIPAFTASSAVKKVPSVPSLPDMSSFTLVLLNPHRFM